MHISLASWLPPRKRVVRGPCKFQAVTTRSYPTHSIILRILYEYVLGTKYIYTCNTYKEVGIDCRYSVTLMDIGR